MSLSCGRDDTIHSIVAGISDTVPSRPCMCVCALALVASWPAALRCLEDRASSPCADCVLRIGVWQLFLLRCVETLSHDSCKLAQTSKTPSTYSCGNHLALISPVVCLLSPLTFVMPRWLHRGRWCCAAGAAAFSIEFVACRVSRVDRVASPRTWPVPMIVRSALVCLPPHRVSTAPTGLY